MVCAQSLVSPMCGNGAHTPSHSVDVDVALINGCLLRLSRGASISPTEPRTHMEAYGDTGTVFGCHGYDMFVSEVHDMLVSEVLDSTGGRKWTVLTPSFPPPAPSRMGLGVRGGTAASVSPGAGRAGRLGHAGRAGRWTRLEATAGQCQFREN